MIGAPCRISRWLPLALVIASGSLGAQTLIEVPGDYATIQEGIAAAQPGDTVSVGQGEYLENISFLGKAITVRSLAGPQETIINGITQLTSAVRFDMQEGPDSVLEGFTITGGGDTRGGGIYCEGAGPTLRDLEIAGNGGAYGGGLYVWDSPHAMVIENCTFSGNAASSFGGGMLVWGPGSVELDSCRFSGNSSNIAVGGAILAMASCTLIGCEFEANDGGIVVGGLAIGDVVSLGIPYGITLSASGCRFEGNTAQYNGAIAFLGAEGTVTASEFIANSAVSTGVGILDAGSTILFERCLFAGNETEESAATIGSSPNVSSATFDRCTFADNTSVSGSVVNARQQSEVEMRNCIVWGNSAPQALYFVLAAQELVEYCAIEGGYPGTGNFDEDPLYVDLAAGDFHLTPASPCIDAGDPQSPLDPDDTPADMGAFFFDQSSLIEFIRGDANADATVNIADVIWILNLLFLAGPAAPCADSADANDDGIIGLSDVFRIIIHLFVGGLPPAAPFPSCGEDPTADPIDCAAPPDCTD
ncbi:MAG: right-handed parallel beta-helix repeat-containing protein [Planctomycetota bacterium]